MAIFVARSAALTAALCSSTALHQIGARSKGQMKPQDEFKTTISTVETTIEVNDSFCLISYDLLNKLKWP